MSLPIWSTSPVAEVLATILEALHPGKVSRKTPGDDREYLVVSYREDFDFLWKLDEALFNWLERVYRTIVLVWEETPRESGLQLVNIADYVTAYDWAVAVSLAAKAHGQRKGLSDTPAWRLLILDLASAQHNNVGVARLFQRLQQGNHAILPRVRVHDMTQADQFLLALQETPALDSSPLDLDLLRRLWAAALTKPGDRHAIANLVGPQVLLAGMQEPTAETNWSTGVRGALERLMEAVGLVPEVSDREPGPWFPPEEWRDYVDSFFLLDDMHDVGWSNFLKLALGITTDNILWACDSPDRGHFGADRGRTLIELLAANGQLQINRRLTLSGPLKEVLFLDLRLFGRRTRGEEIAFFKELLKLAEQARDDSGNRTDLPWRGFTSHELHAVKSCIELGEEKRETDDYFIALTLLPRLIALVDPMLPIVLFSSTGQRRIAEGLKGYGSIITDFDKPRFFGETTSDIVGATRIRFERACTRALRLLKGRLVYQSLLINFRGAMQQTAGSYGNDPYVEIYIDESGKPSEKKFRVGGLAVIYQGEDKAKEFNKAFLQDVNAALLQDGVVWGPTDIDHKDTDPIVAKEGKPSTYYQSMVFTPADKNLKKVRAQAIGFSLLHPSNVDWSDSLNLASTGCLDNLYRTLVLQALEVLLFEVIPGYLGKPSFKCGLYVATRIRVELNADARGAWDELPLRYGVNISRTKLGGERFFRSVGSDSVYAIAAQVLALDLRKNIQIVAARGARLPPYYSALQKPELPRPAHQLADLVTRHCIRDNSLSVMPSLRAWVKDGFKNVANEQFELLLQACRHARDGRYVEALLTAHKAGRVDKWAKQRIADSLHALSGLEFIEFCERLPASRSGQTSRLRLPALSEQKVESR